MRSRTVVARAPSPNNASREHISLEEESMMELLVARYGLVRESVL